MEERERKEGGTKKGRNRGREERRMNGCVDKKEGERIEGRKDEWVEGREKGRKEEREEGRMDGWMEGCIRVTLDSSLSRTKVLKTARCSKPGVLACHNEWLGQITSCFWAPDFPSVACSVLDQITSKGCSYSDILKC